MAKVVAADRSTQSLRTLSAAELQTYHEQGYVVLDNVFPPEDVTAINDEIERLLPEYGDTQEHRPGWIFQLGLRSEFISEFAREERILALIEDIVQPGIAIHSAKLVSKVPHSDIVCHWHQDEAFYTRPNDPKSFSQTRMSVWVPLQDANEANGCMWVVPGSHRWGLQDYVVMDYGACVRRLSARGIRQRACRSHAVAGGFDAALPRPALASLQGQQHRPCAPRLHRLVPGSHVTCRRGAAEDHPPRSLSRPARNALLLDRRPRAVSVW